MLGSAVSSSLHNRSVEKFSPGQTRRLSPEELHLRLGDGGLVVEEEPGDGLAAGGRGQGALVPVVAPPVPGQQGVEGELGHVLGAAALGLHPLARLRDGPQEDVVILQVNYSDYVSLLKLRLSISVVDSPQAKVDFVAGTNIYALLTSDRLDVFLSRIQIF